MPRPGRLSKEQFDDSPSDAYALNTCTFSNGGRSLYPEHLALYQQELAEERRQDEES